VLLLLLVLLLLGLLLVLVLVVLVVLVLVVLLLLLAVRSTHDLLSATNNKIASGFRLPRPCLPSRWLRVSTAVGAAVGATVGAQVGATTTSTKPHQATKSKAQAGSCGFRSTRAATESVSSHSPIRRDEIWV
jgi:hypothetical protein